MNLMEEHLSGQNFGLFDLLSSPELIPQFDTNPNIKNPESIKPNQWRMLYNIASNVAQMMPLSLQLDSNAQPAIYAVETYADNGVLFPYRHPRDPSIKATIYLSSHGMQLSDWDKSLMIKPERIKCHQIQITSRKQIAPNITTASIFQFRITPDFSAIEGDPTNTTALKTRDMLINDETFLFNTFTHFHISFIELLDPESGDKSLMPLIVDSKKFWQTTMESENAGLLSRLLTGKLTSRELSKLEQSFVDFGGVNVIDYEQFIETALDLSKDVTAGVMATQRLVPIGDQYISDLNQLTNILQPTEFDETFLPAKPLDMIGAAKSNFLRKRAERNMGGWVMYGGSQ